MIAKYSDSAAYAAAGLPTAESRVAKIESTNEIKVDGINVEVQVPELGDAVYHDGSQVRFYKGGKQLNPAALPDNIVNNKVGEVLAVQGDYALIANKDAASYKACDVLQYKLTAPTLDGAEHTQSIGLRLSGGTSAGYAEDTVISFTYTATTLAEVVTALNAAIEAKQTEVGFTNTVWAYLIDDDYNKVTDDATGIMVQIDTWNDYRQNNVSGGTLVTWRDMPSSSTNGWRVNGNTEGSKLLSASRAAIYYAPSDKGRTATQMVQLNENAQIVNKATFDGQYGALLRGAYGTYENYIKQEYSLMFPQKLGVFGLPDGKYLTQKYGNITAPTKDGGTKYMFPAFHYALTIGYGIDGISAGDFYCPGVTEGVIMMNDDNREIYNETAAKMGISQINNSTHRWFSQRSSVYSFWYFIGTNGSLGNGGVSSSYSVQGVVLLKIKH